MNETIQTEYKPLQPFTQFVKRFNVSDLKYEQKQRLAKVKVERTKLERLRPDLFYDCNRNEKQYKFHCSNSKIRFMIGGNRSGKTVSGTMESVWTATGRHPFRKINVPNNGWVVSLDFPTSRDVAEVEIRRWLPKQDIMEWNKVDRTIKLTNGSTIGFKSCDSGYTKFQGVKRDWIWFDEQPDYLVWQESYIRTIDSGGLLWCTMTPTQGMSWVYDEIYEMRGIDPDISITEMAMYENPWIDKEAIKKTESTLSPEERLMRIEGKFVQFSGLILKNFNKDVHVIPSFGVPVKAKRYRGIDHGENNPTACIWLFCIPSRLNEKVEEYYVYDEYYETDKTAETNARLIKEITGTERIESTMIDPSTNHRSGFGKSIRQIYFDNGVTTRLGNNDHDALRAARDDIRKLLDVNPLTGRPQLYIFDTCLNTVKEALRWRYKTYRGKYEKNMPDEPAKVQDHLMQSLCYLIQGRPGYYTDDDNVPATEGWYH